MASLGDIIKEYEFTIENNLTKKIPVIIRLDGKNFHTYTKIFKKPFDVDMIKSMQYSALKLIENIQGAKVAYTQSDECSILLTDYEKIETQGWLNYKINKIISIASSIFTYYFNDIIKQKKPYLNKPAFFDCRAFNIPKDDIANYFLWRARDWKRNSLNQYARIFYSQKQMFGKKQEDVHEMLYAKGKNWIKDLSSVEKNGTFIYIKKDKTLDKTSDILPNYQDISKLIDNFT